MPYFLSDKNLSTGKEVEIAEEEARHILLSHRIRVGEHIKLQGPDGKRFLSEVTKTGKKALSAKPLESLPVPPEPSVKITLFQAVVSEKALDFIFQKGTEIGLSQIVLFNSANTATKLTQEIFKRKYERWNKILSEAAKQSERTQWPELLFEKDLESAIKLMTQEKIFLADITGKKFSALTPNSVSLGLVIGPEGGFAPEEISKIQGVKNLQNICLSNFVLRAETAAIAGMAMLINLV